MPYIAFTCILGVLEAVILSKTAQSSSSDYIVYWLLYTVACGAIINYDAALPAGILALMSLPSPTIIGLVYVYEYFFNGIFNFSGNSIYVKNLPHFWPILGLAWLFTVIAIWLFSFARPLVLSAINTAMSPKEAGKIEKALNWAVRIGTSAFVIVKALR
jgi:hypothetical protein